MPKEKGKKENTKLSIKEKMEEEYQKVDQIEHVLLRPDTYIGSIEKDTRPMWVYNPETGLTFDDISFVPGFFKIFDEVLVNARDHQIRDKNCKLIKAEINKEEGCISVFNDGNGLPVVVISVRLEKDKPKVDMYVPELTFGYLLSGSNFHDDRDKTVGGRNGYGAKLANIFSKRFIVETVYCNKKESIFKKFVQEYKNNMSERTTPVITDVKEDTKPYTKITFYPDFEKFGMKGLTDDTIGLLNKRVYDISACTNEKVEVYLNNKKIKVKKFEDYIKMHYDKMPQYHYEEINDRWKVGVVYVPDKGNNQISFVNGIWTYIGGTHVEYIANQVTKKIIEHIKAQSKYKTLTVKPSHIREHLTFFIDSVINEPAFSGQTKGELITKVSNYGSECDLGAGFISKIIKNTGLIDLVTKLAQAKDMAGLNKSDGKRVSVLNIPKLDDAHWAGKRKSKETRLILTEGDSAKAFAISGIKVLGRERYGAFPLKGKLLNVRNATAAQIKKNVEFEYIKKILGLKQGVKYKDTSKLRYGGIIILTDQDADGSHIKGLIINMFQFFWPELLQIEGFIQTLSTPLVKVFKKSDKNKKNPKIFYTLSEYELWEEAEIKSGGITKWIKPKYYKGLGTSSEKEAREIFNDFENRIITYLWEKSDLAGNAINSTKGGATQSDTKSLGSKNSKKSSDTKSSKKSDNSDDENENENDDEDVDKDKDVDKDGANDEVIYNSKSYKSIIKAFDENLANDRKVWLSTHNKHNILEYNKQQVTYTEFIDKELIHFSAMDNVRSIPSIIDGFKPSHRKILHACFKKNQKSEIKVAQLAAYVSEHTAYKHGEKSMEEAIVGMAQRFPGSNNIYTLHPCGNFGFRRQGGDEHASSRYIFTHLDPITRKIFIEQDECVLNYQEDEGDMIEPEYFCPIIPMLLVNGSKGVGTGYSTDVPQYNPIDICKNIMRKLDGKEFVEMHPWYHGFMGGIAKQGEGKYKVTGKFEVLTYNTVKITEIPIKGPYCWSEKYEEFLNTLIDDGKGSKSVKKLLSIIPDCGNNEIKLTVEFRGSELQDLIKKSNDGREEVEKYLKLSANMSASNMWLYNTKGIITHYNNPTEIMEEFFDFRLKMYATRKKYHLRYLNNELEILKNKVRFIQEVIDDKIVIKKKKKIEIVEKLKKSGYPKLSPKLDAIDPPEDFVEDEDKEDVELDNDGKKKESTNVKSYKYLTDMPLFALSTEKIDELNKKYKDKKDEFDDYNSTTEVEFWKRELKALMDYYPKWLDDRQKEEEDDNVADLDAKGKKKSKKSKAKDEDNDEGVNSDSDEKPKKASKKSKLSKNR